MSVRVLQGSVRVPGGQVGRKTAPAGASKRTRALWRRYGDVEDGVAVDGAYASIEAPADAVVALSNVQGGGRVGNSVCRGCDVYAGAVLGRCGE